MDHLRGARLSEPLVKVPYVRKSGSDLSSIYNSDTFLNFPLHHLKSLRSNHPEISKDDALLSLIQSWLIFGTLIEFFRGKVVPKEFRKILEDGSEVLTTKQLRKMMACWPEYQYGSDDISKEEVHKTAVETSGQLLARSLFACERFGKVKSNDDRLHRVLFSVKVLICTLTLLARSYSPESNMALDAVLTRARFKHSPDGSPESTFLLWDSMIENRWCPHQIHYMLQTQPATSVCHMAHTKRPEWHGEHHSCDKHEYCVAHQIDWETFEPTHDHSASSHGPGCCLAPKNEEVALLEKQMMALLDKGKIPLVSCVRNPNNSLRLDVIEARQGVDYTAITHVWADGLGSAKSNQLPACRLQKVLAAIRLVEKKDIENAKYFKGFRRRKFAKKRQRTIFWMDIFCVPKGSKSERHRILEQRAISLMTATYVGAKYVLVLDSELQSIPCKDTDRRTFGFHLMSCRWMGRCWTLQEGALASPSSLWYDFSDGVLPHNKIESFGSPTAAVDCRGPVKWHKWWVPLKLPFVGNFTFRLSQTISIQEYRFITVWNSFLGRSTTKPKDVHVVLANLLGFSALEISELSSKVQSPEENEELVDRRGRSERMKAMLLAQDRLPLELFSISQAEPSTQPRHLSWIPDAPTGRQITGLDTRMVNIDGEVLKVDSHCGPYGFFVTIPSSPQLRTFCINVAATPEEPHICITLDMPQHNTSGDFYLHLNLHKEAHSLIQDTYGTGACFAVLRRQGHEVEVRFESALRFCHCWETHLENGSSDIFLPVESETAHHRISISLHPLSVYKPSTQRPADLFDFFPKRRLSLRVILPTTVLLWFAGAGICIAGHIQFGSSFFAVTWAIILYFPFLAMTCIMYLTRSSWLMSYTTGDVPWYVKVASSRWAPSFYNVRIWSRWTWIRCQPGVLWIRRLKPGRSVFKFSKKASGSTTELISKDRQDCLEDEDATCVNAPDYDAFKDMENIAYKMLDEEYARVLCAMDRQMWWADKHTG